MQLRFWGVRGSVSWATAESIGCGCNTPCVELVDTKSGARLLLDAGSGIVGAGRHIASGPVPIVLTHYHWDHLQGLPFFEPLYRSACSVTLWAPSLGSSGQSWLPVIFQSPFFPIPYDELSAPPSIELLSPGRTQIGPFDVQAVPLSHPGGAFAYRVGVDGHDVVYATDHEHGNEEIDARLVQFATGARAAIFDAHFTPDELPPHRGWGHSSWLEAATDAAAAQVERLFLFHHKPGRRDPDILEIEAHAQRVFKATTAAVEGTCFSV